MEGSLHIFDCSLSNGASPTDDSAADTTAATAPAPAAAAERPPTAPRRLRLAATETIEPNLAAALVVDVDGDGRAELLVGGADGVIQVLGWAAPAREESGGRGDEEGEEEDEDAERVEAWDSEGEVDDGASTPHVQGTPPIGSGQMASSSPEGGRASQPQQQQPPQRSSGRGAPPSFSYSSAASSWVVGSGSFDGGAGGEGGGPTGRRPQMWEKGRAQVRRDIMWMDGWMDGWM